jgi:hypothetical protein
VRCARGLNEHSLEAIRFADLVERDAVDARATTGGPNRFAMTA